MLNVHVHASHLLDVGQYLYAQIILFTLTLKSLSSSVQMLAFKNPYFEIYDMLKMCFRPHYSVNMTAVQVGHTFLSLATDASQQGDRKGTIIDSGTTLAYLPEGIYEPLVSKVYKSLTSCKFTLQLHVL